MLSLRNLGCLPIQPTKSQSTWLCFYCAPFYSEWVVVEVQWNLSQWNSLAYLHILSNPLILFESAASSHSSDSAHSTFLGSVNQMINKQPKLTLAHTYTEATPPSKPHPLSAHSLVYREPKSIALILQFVLWLRLTYGSVFCQEAIVMDDRIRVEVMSIGPNVVKTPGWYFHKELPREHHWWWCHYRSSHHHRHMWSVLEEMEHMIIHFTELLLFLSYFLISYNQNVWHN